MAVPRNLTIDIAKAIAIILVVWGHYEPTHAPGAFEIINRVIYLFHMPLFIFASGYIYQATYRPETSYTTFLRKKFMRLLVPYFSTSIVIITLKLFTSGSIDNPVTPLDYLSMLWSPSAGYFLWFIWALWCMMVIAPVFNTTRRRVLFVALSLILRFTADWFPAMFCLDQFARMAVFFAVGMLVSGDMNYLVKRHEGKVIGLSTVAFVLLALYLVSFNRPTESMPWIDRVLYLAAGFAGTAVTIGVAKRIAQSSMTRMRNSLIAIAAASYFIYLFHTTFEGFAKVAIVKAGLFNIIGHGYPAFTVAFLIVVGTGLLVPYLLSRYIIPRSRLLGLLFNGK